MGLRVTALLAFGLLGAGPVLALDSTLTIAQLTHRTWSGNREIPAGVESFAQDPDGPFWLLGHFGAAWFDGTEWQPLDTAPTRLQSTDVSAGRVSSKGELWMGFRFGGVTSVLDGMPTEFRVNDGIPSGRITGIVEDADQNIWIAARGGLSRRKGSRWQRIGADWNFPAQPVAGVFADRAGHIWVATNESVLRLAPGSHQFESITGMDVPPEDAATFGESPDGTVWVSHAGRGVLRIQPRENGKPQVQTLFGDLQVDTLLVDRDGNLWMGGAGLHRMVRAHHQPDFREAAVPALETFRASDGLSGNSVRSLFEDREGNLWVNTAAGIDRFSRTEIVKLPVPGGLDGDGSIVAGSTDTLWITDKAAPAILKIQGGRLVQTIASPEFTVSYADANGTIWFAGPHGVARLVGDRLEVTPLPASIASTDVQALVSDAAGRIWVSIASAGLFRLDNGHWQRNGNLTALPSEPATAAAVNDRGDIWLGYSDNRLARISKDTVTFFGSDVVPEVGSVKTLHAKAERLWIGGDRGLGVFDGQRFHGLRATNCQPFRAVNGVLETDRGELWVYRPTGLSQFSQGVHDALTEGPNASRPVYCTRTLNVAHGIPGALQFSLSTPVMTEASNGHIWFVAAGGAGWINPGRVVSNARPPPITVRRVDAGDQNLRPRNGMKLPAGTASLTIHYAAWSLTIPERTRFRYRLHGFDSHWQTVGQRHEAVYTNLGPGQYRFEVAGANDDLVWSAAPASLTFVILPKLTQTSWFYALCALLIVGALAGLFRLQSRRVSTQLRDRMEERSRERERIARELHDTLLQGVQGLILRFQAVSARIPREAHAHDMMERALDQADAILIESRDRVTGLRESSDGSSNLPQALADASRSLSLDPTVETHVQVRGTIKALDPGVGAEAYLIAREALYNAVRHSAATRIDVELNYDRASLSLTVRDNGRGIADDVIRAGGRSGHWGLRGMRERARKLRAILEIRSTLHAGTEVELRVPAALAYRGRITSS